MGRRGYIFDMDGTLVDNVQYHVKAWKAFSRKYGNELSEDKIVGWMGMTNRVYQERILGRPVGDEESLRMSEEKESMYRELFAAHMRLPDGLRALLDRARDAGVVCAVATGAPASNVNFIMDGLSLRDDFKAMVIAREFVSKGVDFADIGHVDIELTYIAEVDDTQETWPEIRTVYY